MFLAELAANASLRQEIREAIEGGLPVYAECGGLMYLSRRIRWGRLTADMVGALPYEIEMTDEPQGHGYVLAECSGKNPFFEQGAMLRGHEFHHSRLVSPTESISTVFDLKRGVGVGGKRDGLVYKNVLACYTHLHAGGAPKWAPSLVAKALEHAGLSVTRVGG
jgi:cobyrinic acid a,c-diamide synthase